MAKKLPKGWRRKTIIDAFGDKMELITTDLRTREGKNILKMARLLANNDSHLWGQ